MKIRHLLFGMLAIAATAACNRQEEPAVEPKLDVDKAAVSVAATAGEATFNVTSNQSWVATADKDWVSLEPASGAASEKAVAVKVTAEDNETTSAREATVTVKAGDLTKTVKVTQAAGQGGETPGPELPASEWALVGSFNGWDQASETYLSVLDEEYFVCYGFELEASTEFKFLKGGAWPPAGTEIGGNGLVEPNTIQPAGGSNIKVTEAGTYDIYLAADLTKFYVMSEGKLPSEATEPAPVENQWGMMGCFVDNQWSSDVPMAKEGEWIVAKGAQFTELTFKIRANGSWADAGNIGVAPGSERGVVNGKISVVTAEYAKANLGGDAADIKLNGEAGTYDVYFSFENLEVYVMEQGYKPGEKEPQNPAPVEITYTVTGTIADHAWVNNYEGGLMVAEGDYLVAKNVPFVWNSTCYGGDYDRIEFKVLETGTWSGYAYPEKNVDQYANAEIAVSAGGENIAVDAPEGTYDVYFDKANQKVWVMEAGYKPGEKEPLVPEVEPMELPYLSAVYFGNQYGATENDYNYSLVLSTAQNVIDPVLGYYSITANNTYLLLDMFASQPSENYSISFTVPEGEYVFDVDNTVSAGTISAEYTYLYVTGDEEGEQIYFASGKVTVTADRIDAEFVAEDGTVYSFYTNQVAVNNKDRFVGDGYQGEFSTLEGDLAIPFDEPGIYAECNGDYYVVGKNDWYLYIDDYATGQTLLLEVLTPLEDEIPIGEFVVSSDLNLDRMILPGFVSGYGEAMWSWYALYGEDGYEVLSQAPIVDGKVTITDNGDETYTAVCDLVDDLGNKITGECVANYDSVNPYMRKSSVIRQPKAKRLSEMPVRSLRK